MTKPFIVIEGPIGVGKSSLTHKLSQSYHFYEAKEIVGENPFLSDFYEDISKWSFQTEMFFLCNRYKAYQDLAELHDGIVCDYHIYKNKIFARNTLSQTEYEKFSRIYDILTEDLITPDYTIILDADLSVLKKRIAKRDRSFEAHIEDDYLLKLKEDYATYYKQLTEDGHQVLWIDTTDIDFVSNPEDYDQVLSRINELIGGQSHDKL
ncbi:MULTISPECIES: deoxynucleoside kinase [unclassified Staphylococcus]|uniref:deoxynucleoside kinase n=1 Tax=unclassified Staphylococcus TaxID=91994 RepID=UPI0021D0C35E|nr:MULTISPECIES: deoxynucleoside kinase [unclassified Staphylococcus]UXR69823.1 deoxynucleoside kinase [Staphylococcus sp. IVB6246]UXR71861.1 deoxynucleoside kinase [Staphylococcus sp. IVB6240]UXR74167.1 deoxynucleoside kinase [Staphylococcus sp. IVB6238]UXR76557.1 deoxynucleoside kinase [Staphylococcus sp. IVB6233]UXR80685.1 deoxynucleoside kinase [Staphylococcus sp. IVB6218]